jgi:hypothetical protein
MIIIGVVIRPITTADRENYSLTVAAIDVITEMVITVDFNIMAVFITYVNNVWLSRLQQMVIVVIVVVHVEIA